MIICKSCGYPNFKIIEKKNKRVCEKCDKELETGSCNPIKGHQIMHGGSGTHHIGLVPQSDER